jgi:hypothetical protein
LDNEVLLKLASIAVKCFRPDQDDRFQSAGALRREIANIATG